MIHHFIDHRHRQMRPLGDQLHHFFVALIGGDDPVVRRLGKIAAPELSTSDTATSSLPLASNLSAMVFRDGAAARKWPG